MSFALRQRPFAVGASVVFATSIAFGGGSAAQEPPLESTAPASQPAPTSPLPAPATGDADTPAGEAEDAHAHGDDAHGVHGDDAHGNHPHSDNKHGDAHGDAHGDHPHPPGDRAHQGQDGHHHHRAEASRRKVHHRHHRRHSRREVSLCRRGNPALAQGPLGSTYQAGAFGAARRLCPRTDVGIFIRAPVTAEIGEELFVDLVGGAPDFVIEALRGREQFYVNAAAGSGVALAWSPVERVELFLEIEALRAQYIRASVTSTALGFGHLSPGATVVLSQSPTHAIGVTGRAQLPTATGFYKNVFPFGLDAGVSGALLPYSFLRLHGYVGGSGAVAVGPVADARAGMVAVGGVEILPFDWLSFVADLNGRLLYEDPLDHLSVALGVRAAVFSTVGLEFVAMAPLVGAERGLGAVMARATWRLGDLSVRRLLKGDVMWDEALYYRRK